MLEIKDRIPTDNDTVFSGHVTKFIVSEYVIGYILRVLIGYIVFQSLVTIL
jgi:hypothetical protein